VGLTSQEAGAMCFTCIPADRAGEVGVNWACQPIVTKGIAGDAPRAEILSRQHTPCGHDSYECVEGR